VEDKIELENEDNEKYEKFFITPENLSFSKMKMLMTIIS
jgi:hypothetical protein